METGKSFLGALFDFSFSDFITPKIIKVLYILGVVLAGLYALFFIVLGFNLGTGSGTVFLLLSPLIFLIMVIFIRVGLEIYLVIFQIGDNTREIVRQGRVGGGTGAPPTPM